MDREANVPDASGLGGSKGHLLVDESPAHTEPSARKGDATGDSNAAHLVVGGVGEDRQGFGEGAGTGCVSGDGRIEREGVVRAFPVVEVPPGVEGALAVLQVGEGATGQEFAFQG